MDTPRSLCAAFIALTLLGACAPTPCRLHTGRRAAAAAQTAGR